MSLRSLMSIRGHGPWSNALRAARTAALAYTTLIRGLPELVLMLMVFYGGQGLVNAAAQAAGYVLFARHYSLMVYPTNYLSYVFEHSANALRCLGFTPTGLIDLTAAAAWQVMDAPTNVARATAGQLVIGSVATKVPL